MITERRRYAILTSRRAPGWLAAMIDDRPPGELDLEDIAVASTDPL